MGVCIRSPGTQTWEAHKHKLRESRQRPVLHRMWPAPPHIACPRAITRQNGDQTTIYTCADKFQTHILCRSCIWVLGGHLSLGFIKFPALNLAPNVPFDLLKSFQLLRTYPLSLFYSVSPSPFLSLCIRHKEVSHSNRAVGRVRWFRGKGSWQTGSFLTARGDIIAGLLGWIPNDHPQRENNCCDLFIKLLWSFLLSSK